MGRVEAGAIDAGGTITALEDEADFRPGQALVFACGIVVERGDGDDPAEGVRVEDGGRADECEGIADGPGGGECGAPQFDGFDIGNDAGGGGGRDVFCADEDFVGRQRGYEREMVRADAVVEAVEVGGDFVLVA